MINKFKHFVLHNLDNITKYVFWSYFYIIIAYYSFINNEIPVPMGYLFWFLLGIRLGYLIAIEAVGYINKRE